MTFQVHLSQNRNMQKVSITLHIPPKSGTIKELKGHLNSLPVRFLKMHCEPLNVSEAVVLKKRLWHRCFTVNFAKFLRTPFLQNTSGLLLLMSYRISELALGNDLSRKISRKEPRFSKVEPLSFLKPNLTQYVSSEYSETFATDFFIT